MPADAAADLAELISSKICHDLISPLSAISNGIEFLSDGDMADDAIGLISKSASQGAARLAIFRLAFGGWGGGGSRRLAEIAGEVEAFLTNQNIGLDWTLSAPDFAVEKPAGKLLVNLILMAAECVHRNGRLTVAEELSRPGRPVRITVEAERAGLHEDVAAVLASGPDAAPPTVRTVLTHYAWRLAAGQDSRIWADTDGGVITLGAGPA